MQRFALSSLINSLKFLQIFVQSIVQKGPIITVNASLWKRKLVSLIYTDGCYFCWE